VLLCSSLLFSALQKDTKTTYTALRNTQSRFTLTVTSPSSCPIGPPPPAPTAKCGWNGYDFRQQNKQNSSMQQLALRAPSLIAGVFLLCSLCSSLTAADFVGSDGASNYAYYLHLCGPLTSPAASTCTQVDSASSACQLQVAGGAQTFDLGNWNTAAPPVWAWMEPSKPDVGVQYTMTGVKQW
jgi:hypothetical protein